MGPFPLAPLLATLLTSCRHQLLLPQLHPSFQTPFSASHFSSYSPVHTLMEFHSRGFDHSFYQMIPIFILFSLDFCVGSRDIFYRMPIVCLISLVSPNWTVPLSTQWPLGIPAITHFVHKYQVPVTRGRAKSKTQLQLLNGPFLFVEGDEHTGYRKSKDESNDVVHILNKCILNVKGDTTTVYVRSASCWAPLS